MNGLTRFDISAYLCFILSILIIVIIFYTSYASGSGILGYQYGTNRSSILEHKSRQTENSLGGGMSNKPIFKTISDPNERIVILDDKKGLEGPELPVFLRDPHKSCNTIFKCIVNSSTGWHDNTSIQISTMNTVRNKWSSIIGQEVHVKPLERYQLVSHMKMNKAAKWSNILIEGFNESSKKWGEILKCPFAKSLLEWNESMCSMTIENNVTKVRPVFNAGWSSQPGREAITWFDFLYMTKFKPFITDPKLKAEVVYAGLDSPTSMAFLGPNDIIVLEKNKGTVQRIVNGVKSEIPLPDVNVATSGESGMLGIALGKNMEGTQSSIANESTYVFLYFTASEKDDHDFIEGKAPMGNRLYRYEFVNNSLVDPLLLLDLPAGYYHNGGPILIGPDNDSVYLAIGDLENEGYKVVPHKALNNKTGLEPDGSGGILRFTQNGKPIDGGILGNKYPLSLYYAYGIRESFGMDFDPVTGKLWDTENGHDAGDEINMLEPGFNGGWNKVQGIWPYIEDHTPDVSDITYIPSDLVDFNGKGKYHAPQFTWNRTVGPTALTFLSTDKLGKQYQNDMLVADVNNGRIYHFELNQDRNQLHLEGPLMDKVADNDGELENVIFAGDFGLITDLEVGPDGYLYFVVFNEGKIYRIIPNNQNYDVAN
jgi:aldose sugar dehydrogenase